MAHRRTVLAALLAAATLATPALAEPKPGVGVGVQFAGNITVSTVLEAVPGTGMDRAGDGSVRTVPGYDVHGACSYTGQLLPNNTLEIVVVGAGFATATVTNPQVALATEVKCHISNTAGDDNTLTILAPGPATAQAFPALNYHVASIKICATIIGHFGPIPPTDKATNNGNETCDVVLV